LKLSCKIVTLFFVATVVVFGVCYKVFEDEKEKECLDLCHKQFCTKENDCISTLDGTFLSLSICKCAMTTSRFRMYEQKILAEKVFYL
jgi:hypothetical protein